MVKERKNNSMPIKKNLTFPLRIKEINQMGNVKFKIYFCNNKGVLPKKKTPLGNEARGENTADLLT